MIKDPFIIIITVTVIDRTAIQVSSAVATINLLAASHAG